MSLLTEFQIRCMEDKEFAESVLRTLGGPGSGWSAEGGHVAGSQGGKSAAKAVSEAKSSMGGTGYHEVKHPDASSAAKAKKDAVAHLQSSGFKVTSRDSVDDAGMSHTYLHHPEGHEAEVVHSRPVGGAPGREVDHHSVSVQVYRAEKPSKMDDPAHRAKLERREPSGSRGRGRG